MTTSSNGVTKKPILLNLLVCDSHAQGPEGKPTLYGVFDRVGVDQVPTAHAEMTLFMTFGYGKTGKYAIRFNIVSPSGKILIASPDITFDLANDHVVHNINIRFQGFPIPEEGFYRTVVYFKGEEIPVEDKILFLVHKVKKG